MKCINCYREIDDNLKFCNFCGAKQPVDREVYEREHPELAEALSEEEVMEQERQRQIEESERLRQEAELKEQEEVERKAREAEEKAQAEAKAREESSVQMNSAQTESVNHENLEKRPQTQQGSVYRPPVYNNLIACPECGHLVSPRAYSCPQCGCPIRGENYVQPQQNPVTKENDNKKGNTGVLWLLLTIGLIALLIAVLSSKGCSNQATVYEMSTDTSVLSETDNIDTVLLENVTPEVSANSVKQQEETTTESEISIDLTENGNYHLTGTVAGQGCKMDLTIDGSDVYGTYSYKKYGKPLGLQGTIYDDEVQLDEISEDGETTGELYGHVSGNTFSGTHTRYKTMKDTHFSFKAQ